VTYRETCSVDCPACSSTVLVGENYCSRCGAALDGLDDDLDGEGELTLD
jgi:DNA-directed RNA polymerase subunit RPC12/RpoP